MSAPVPEPVRGRIRTRTHTRVSHGLYRPVDGNELLAWQLVLPPEGRFTHLTAAKSYGWWLPPLPDGLPVFAAVGELSSRPQRAGLRMRRTRGLTAHVRRDDLRLDPAADTLLACARDLSALDLVVLIDAALHAGDVTLTELEVVSRRRVPGAPKLRAATMCADARSESAWETLLRELHRVCDVPVVPQHELHDVHGSFVARADLWVVGTNALHEYDGGDHLTTMQQRKDLARARRIGHQEWVRRGYTSKDVLRQGVTILRDADASLGREHRPERARAWHRLIAESLFTPSGQSRFSKQLGLETSSVANDSDPANPASLATD